MAGTKRAMLSKAKTEERGESAEQVLASLLKRKPEKLNEEEVKFLMEQRRGAKIESERASKHLGRIDNQIREASKNLDLKGLEAQTVRFQWSAGESWTCSPVKLLNLLHEEGKMKLLPNLISIQITSIKKYLGSEVLKDIGKKESKEWGSLQFYDIKR